MANCDKRIRLPGYSLDLHLVLTVSVAKASSSYNVKDRTTANGFAGAPVAWGIAHGTPYRTCRFRRY